MGISTAFFGVFSYGIRFKNLRTLLPFAVYKWLAGHWAENIENYFQQAEKACLQDGAGCLILFILENVLPEFYQAGRLNLT